MTTSLNENLSGVAEVLTRFLGPCPFEIMSIGQNCNTAWYLKEVGARRSSGPFDWVFSSAEIVADCLEDEFRSYLDKTLIYPIQDGTAAGHRLYHASMFNHRNPLASDEDYAYFCRSARRLLDLVSMKGNFVLVCTLINEPEKRTGWSNGFTNQFRLPLKQHFTIYDPVKKIVWRTNPNTKFVFIDHYTDASPCVSVDYVDERVICLTQRASGKNSGVKYLSPEDDRIAKGIFTSFTRPPASP